jgi:hypothetical protein
MKIIKRSGVEDTFDPSKIDIAIRKANDTTLDDSDKLNDEQIKGIVDYIINYAQDCGRSLNVEEIQDLVEERIMAAGAFEVARSYITYRYKRALVRKTNSTDDAILSLVSCNNEEIKQENSNKNPYINSTQRDYIAGEVSKDITRRLLLDEDIWDAHENGLIHFHDADYFLQPMTNCFHSDTEFVTDKGVVRFGDCHEGERIFVRNITGNYVPAMVHKYGKQKMQTVTFRSCRTVKTVRCTYNHRWVLKDGTITESLKVGDSLYPTVDTTNTPINNPFMFCLGFVLGDGSDFAGSNISEPTGVRVRLCGNKTQYLPYFTLAGFDISKEKFHNGDMSVTFSKYPLKKNFINGFGWRFLSLSDKIDLFKGYYAADGNTLSNGIATANHILAQMIREISALAGYYITSENFEIRDTNFKKGASLWTFRFMKRQSINRCWKVESIDRSDYHTYDAWCVEEPSTHTFTLGNGMVTGNCCLVNLEDMLQNGTIISETMIETPKSFSTACNVATQAIAQIASNQYGGQSITLSHLAPFVDVSRKKIIRKVIEEFETLGIEYTDEMVNKVTESRVKEEIKKGVQTIQYQVITLMTTNGQAPFITVFMYLDEVPEGQTRDDLAAIIEETLNQRYLGVKNEKGVYITPAFPKLIYVLEEDNIHEDSKYWYLTELAAKCTAKRLVPDYISEKKMREYKNEDCYPCMGCRSFLTPDRTVRNSAKALNYEEGKHKYYGRLTRALSCQ